MSFPSQRAMPALGVSAARDAFASPHTDSDEEPRPPRASPRPHVCTIHGEARIDEFAWLRERTDPGVIAHLESENAYALHAMKHTAALQEELYQEMVARIEETDLSVPEPDGGWLYYSRIEAGRQYATVCRRRAPAGDEEILLDQNALAAGAGFFRLGVSEPSPDHRLLAFSIDTAGDESYTLAIKDLESGDVLPERIPGTARGVAWANDGRTLFYTTLDSSQRPARLYRHRVGTDPALDDLIHDELDPSFFLFVSRSRSGELIVLDLSTHSSSEIRILSTRDPDGEFRVVEPRRPGVEYSVSHHGDRLFIVTNDGAENFRLMQAPLDSPGRASWAPALPYEPAVKLDGVDAFERHLALYERVGGCRRVRVLDLHTGAIGIVPLPEVACTVQPQGNREFRTSVLRLSYTSLVTPACVVDYDMTAGTWTVRKETIVHGYDRARYRSHRVTARAPDGTEVPVSLVYAAPLALDARRPALLVGYGAYGYSYDPNFSANSLSLLDRGWIIAIAHVRGGEELGRRWYDEGRRFNKHNSFVDFIAAAEHLVAAGYTTADRLAISGGSAGGLLMGAVTNLRPDLFRAVVADVPFVDVVNTMLDASLPLTVLEYDEWGDPRERNAYEYMRSYSPYDNVESKAYPHMLVTAGLNDPRVAYWEPAKWVARLRARKTDDNRLLLKTNMGAGHGGASGRYDALREIAFRYAFMMDALSSD